MMVSSVYEFNWNTIQFCFHVEIQLKTFEKRKKNISRWKWIFQDYQVLCFHWEFKLNFMRSSHLFSLLSKSFRFHCQSQWTLEINSKFLQKKKINEWKYQVLNSHCRWEPMSHWWSSSEKENCVLQENIVWILIEWRNKKSDLLLRSDNLRSFFRSLQHFDLFTFDNKCEKRPSSIN